MPIGVAINKSIACKGYAAQSATDQLLPWNFERRKVGARDVLIEIRYCGVCHTDIHFVKNDLGMSVYPIVPGHEIVGVVSRTGNQVSNFKKKEISWEWDVLLNLAEHVRVA